MMSDIGAHKRLDKSALHLFSGRREPLSVHDKFIYFPPVGLLSSSLPNKMADIEKAMTAGIRKEANF